MGFLNPLFLLAAAAVAVPLILHLFHRHESRRIAFPALRYLRRTRKDHARTIRLRQLLLLLLRISTILLLVAAGSRLFVPGTGGEHPPTALAIVLDNSMSSGAILEDARQLDRLRALALASVDRANPGDRIWVLRAGEPWDVATPGNAEEARRKILETGVSAAPASLPGVLERAGSLVAGADFDQAEIHLLSDLQASAFPRDAPLSLPPGVRLVVYRPSVAPPENRHLSDLEIGGGLTPLAGERTAINARVEGDGPVEDLPVRLVWGDRVRGAAEAGNDGYVLVPAGPFPEGWTNGYLEIDPDALRTDDRRYFAFRVRPPPRVVVAGEAAYFLSSALDVLEEGGRAAVSDPAEADVLISVAGAGVDTRRSGTAAIVVPLLDETLLPALNRRLATAGIPWRYDAADAAGEVRVQEQELPHDLSPVRVFRHFRLTPTAADAGARVRATLATGHPWIVSGDAPAGAYLLFASPLEPEATNLPVTAPMIPLLEWLLGQWAAPGRPDGGGVAGEPIRVPREATAIRTPEGTLHALDGTQSFRRTGEVGIYELFRGDSLLEQVAVNAPIDESRLTRIDPRTLLEATGTEATVVESQRAWERAILQGDEGAEIWRPLLLLALVLLLLESWIAAAGPGFRKEPPADAAHPFRRPLKQTR
ncbi:MAG: BatA domain-containing protein [Gemmatimonadota bacterium]